MTRSAIANPDHAPYGRAGYEALKTFGLWNTIQPFIVKGENASQATWFAVSGSSQMGYLTSTIQLPDLVALASTAKKSHPIHYSYSFRELLAK